jgi:hypothetical protein
LRGHTAPLIFSVEFGAMFSHHRAAFYKGMNIERQQQSILQHASADSHLPSPTRHPLLNAVGPNTYHNRLRVTCAGVRGTASQYTRVAY